MKMKIERKATVKTREFENIGPNVSLEFDVDENFDYETIGETLDCLFSLESAVLMAELEDIKNKPKQEYIKDVFKESDDYLKTIKENIAKLTNASITNKPLNG